MSYASHSLTATATGPTTATLSLAVNNGIPAWTWSVSGSGTKSPVSGSNSGTATISITVTGLSPGTSYSWTYTLGGSAGSASGTSNTITTSTYTVTWNANGGSVTPASSSGVTVTAPTPTRTGYSFNGWYTAASGGTLAVAAGGSYTPSSNVTLYAQWTANTYTISYNANGGTGAPTSQTKTYGVTLTLSSTTPTRSGYTFASWNTALNGTGTSYSPGGSYTTNAAATLYAQWTPNTYTVSYDANGGVGAPTAQTKTQDVTLALSSTVPTRTGYTFTGWNTAIGGTGTAYASGASYTANAAVTLYAQWSINTYTVSYNANGGTGAPTSQTKTYGVALTLTSSIPTRTGYTFTGWNTAANGTGTAYASGASYTTDAAVTLYAQWTINTYTISYDANGGTGAPTSQTKTYGVTLTLTSSTPTRTNYTFTSWNTAANGTGTSYPSGASYTTEASVTLYAQWTINAPSWTDNTLATPVLGRVYSDSVSATNSPTYSVSSGALPTGLSLNTSTGAITGTPTTAGLFTFTLTATNAGGSVNQSFTNIKPAGGLSARGATTWSNNKVQVYNGTTWVTGTVWRYNGTAWVAAT